MGNRVIDYESATIVMGPRVVLQNINFTLDEGEFVYLLGKVGSGKSTLLKSLYAETEVETARKASVLNFDMLDLRRKDVPALRRGMGIIFQDFKLLQGLSAKENLDFVLRATGWRNADDRKRRIDEVLELVGLPDSGYKKPFELSGGEQQRVAIARAILNKPKLVIADEPTGNLDPESGILIARLLHSLPTNGQAVVMATHNIDLVRRFPARQVTCKDKGLLNN